MKFILASKSPRRKEILGNLGLEFETVTSEADESYDEGTAPADVVMMLSARKAAAVKAQLESEGRDLSDTVIIAADTVVSACGEILGKPADTTDAERMLHMLEGSTHSVLSGITVIFNGSSASAAEETFVKFAPMTEKEIKWYAGSGEPDDKAGAYAIQGYASMWVEGIDGCYFNVVGLPVACLRKLLGRVFGIKLSEYLK
ncbi:MAG: septum formation protein Maf [Clostridia bacterium]|nr:septum formation protein Maf [Clostridia bacterium]